MPQIKGVRIESHIDAFTYESKEKINNWLAAIAQDAASTAASKAPYDTGALRNSIGSAVDTSSQTAYIGTNIEYAIYQELGTSKIKGKHFLRFGATAHSAEYGRYLEEYLKG